METNDMQKIVDFRNYQNKEQQKQKQLKKKYNKDDKKVLEFENSTNDPDELNIAISGSPEEVNYLLNLIFEDDEINDIFQKSFEESELNKDVRNITLNMEILYYNENDEFHNSFYIDKNIIKEIQKKNNELKKHNLNKFDFVEKENFKNIEVLSISLTKEEKELIKNLDSLVNEYNKKISEILKLFEYLEAFKKENLEDIAEDEKVEELKKIAKKFRKIISKTLVKLENYLITSDELQIFLFYIENYNFLKIKEKDEYIKILQSTEIGEEEYLILELIEMSKNLKLIKNNNRNLEIIKENTKKQSMIEELEENIEVENEKLIFDLYYKFIEIFKFSLVDDFTFFKYFLRWNNEEIYNLLIEK